MKRLLSLVVVGFLFAGTNGCGPVRATAFVLDAEVQVQAARTAGADKLAPYDWTAANLYLHKAREEIGYSDYGVAVDFAEKASKYANQARENALAASRIDDADSNTVVPVP